VAGWTTWIGWCGRSIGSDVKMTFAQGVSARDEVSRDIIISRDNLVYAYILSRISDLSGALTNALDVVPAEAARISLKAKDLKPRDLSNNLFALAKLKDDVPGVLRIVPGIAAQIVVKAKDMNPHELSSCLSALAILKDDAPDILRILPAIAAQIPLKSKDMNPQELCIMMALTY